MSLTITKKLSPNQSPRPAGSLVSAIVLHADASKSEKGTIAWILNPDAKVSYHYLVARHGLITQFVTDDEKAWHAGVSEYDGRKNVNDFSLGVSFANDQKGEDYPEEQIAAGVELVSDLCRKHGIPVARITTHAAVAPGRKVDPGPKFPLAAFLARVGAILAETA